MQIDDQTLMALADGELSPADAAAVMLKVDADPALQARLRQFTETRALLKADAAPAAPSPQDADLIARIRAATTSQTATAAPVAPPEAANVNRRPLAAIAAALALVVVGAVWWQSGGPANTGLGAAQMAQLDELPPGEALELDNDVFLTMIASFRSGEGELCREYETNDGTVAQIAVACREDGGWTQRFATDREVSNGYLPASGDLPELDDFLTQLGAGDPLTPEAEAAALAE